VEIDRNDWDRWKGDPVTKEVFLVLRERQSEIGDKLARGGALIPTEREVAVGRFLEIDDLLTMNYEDMRPVKEE